MSWTLRLLLEKVEHTSTSFVTLTYDPDHCPRSLIGEHFDQFMKALRRASPARVRYFTCGEYGGKTGRPHWHVLLFGMNFKQKGLFNIDLWPHGLVYNGEISQNSAAYVSRYVLKSSNPDPWKEQVIRMSRRPGIGMRSLRSIAAVTARKVPHMPFYPPVLSYDKRHWWLDRHAYEASVKAYLDAGGHLTDESAPCNPMLDSASPPSYPIDSIVQRWARKWDKESHGKAF